MTGTRAAETRTALVRRARKIDRVLAETYPDAKCELDFDNPFELLVVTVLSAQTTDKRVNAVRPALFAAYPDAFAMAAADPEKVERGLAQLVLTLIELLRQLMERQALARMEAGTLTDEQIERLGETFMKLELRMQELTDHFGLEQKDLQLNLGPLGDLF